MLRPLVRHRLHCRDAHGIENLTLRLSLLQTMSASRASRTVADSPTPHDRRGTRTCQASAFRFALRRLSAIAAAIAAREEAGVKFGGRKGGRKAQGREDGPWVRFSVRGVRGHGRKQGCGSRGVAEVSPSPSAAARREVLLTRGGAWTILRSGVWGERVEEGNFYGRFGSTLIDFADGLRRENVFRRGDRWNQTFVFLRCAYDGGDA